MPGPSHPRILVVGPFPPTKGGVTTFMLNLTGSFLNERFDFVPFTTSRPPKKGILNNYGYAAMLRGGIGRVLSGMGITAWHVLKFPFVLASGRIDVVQVQASDYQAFWESAAYVWLALRLGKPVVLRIGGAFDVFHAASPPAIQRLIGKVLSMPQCLIAQSQMAERMILAAGRQGPIVVVPNWPQPAFIRQIDRPEQTQPVFLFIAGSDAHRKGFEEVLAAAESLDRQGSPARFHILAAPQPLQDQIACSGLANVCKVEGSTAHARVLEAMGAADVFLLPSHGEGFPNSLIEAMACGLPSVVTPVGGVPEIADGGGCVVVPARDPVALAGAIHALATDVERRRALGAAAFANLQSRYTAEQVLPPLGEVYDALSG